MPGSRAWFLAKLIEDGVATGVVKALNDDRNDLAHGRQVRDVELIRGDIESYLQIVKWRRRFSDWGAPLPDSLSPWLTVRPGVETHNPEEVAKSIGVFERWRGAEKTYVIPWSGSHFSIINEPGVA